MNDKIFQVLKVLSNITINQTLNLIVKFKEFGFLILTIYLVLFKKFANKKIFIFNSLLTLIKKFNSFVYEIFQHDKFSFDFNYLILFDFTRLDFVTFQISSRVIF